MNFAKKSYTIKNVKHVTDIYNNRRSLWEMFSDILHGRYKMSFMTTLAFILGILYVLLPLDFDWIPVLGWIDDGFVVYWVFKRLLKENVRYNLWRNSTVFTRNRRNEAIEEAEIID